MPRVAKTFQIWVRRVAPSAWSACRIALRMSRNDGSGGDNRIAVVTSRRAAVNPIDARRSHSVSDQISPSACTSGSPKIFPRSPYVYPPVPAVPSPGQGTDDALTGQSNGCVRIEFGVTSV